MTSEHMHRKDEHLALAEAHYRHARPQSSLNGMRIIHRPLPESRLDQVDLTFKTPDFTWPYPFYIEAMTGGSPRTGKLNTQLAQVAKETQLAMAVGSQSIALKDASTRQYFTNVRKENPDGFIIANLGAGHGPKAAQMAIDMLAADALEIHVNVAQELVMAEGDRQFMWLENIQAILAAVSVPVIVKEVGFGMDQDSIQTLTDLGVHYINLGGRSGTNFAEIEARRNRDHPFPLDYMFDWGQTTAESLIEAKAVKPDAKRHIIATGGIQTPLDILKAQVMGAQAVGVAGHFLHTLMQDGPASLTAEIQSWQADLAKLYTLVGANTQADLPTVPYILNPQLLSYAQQRRRSN